jgi:hypothetical protein
MRKPVGDQRVEAFEVEERLDIAMAGGIAIEDGRQIGPEDLSDLGLLRQHIMERLADQGRIHVRMIEALRQAMADRIIETIMREDRRVDEAAELTFRLDNILRFCPNRRPDRIHRLDALANA